MTEVSIRAGNLKLLSVPPGKDFDFCADRALVISESFQRQAQPVILIATFITQQNGWSVILRDQQIGRAIVVEISSNDGARLFELNLVETNVDGDVFETIRTEIAEQLDLALAIFRLADGDQIDPAVVVVVDGGYAVGANPVRFGKLTCSNVFP